MDSIIAFLILAFVSSFIFTWLFNAGGGSISFPANVSGTSDIALDYLNRGVSASVAAP